MRRFIILLLLLCVFLKPVWAAPGDITGSIYTTDIVAYIDGKPINSYNIDGWTGIVAEDLRDYGFDVFWNPEERTLSIDYYILNPENRKPDSEGYGEESLNYTPETSKKKVGMFAGHILSTDIKTYVSGDEVTAFNIGGRTIIFIDELYRFGNVVWHEDERKICYDYVEPWSLGLYKVNYEAQTDKEIASFSLNMSKNQEGEYVTKGENLDYIDGLRLFYNKKAGMCLGFSLYQRVLFKTDDLHNLLYEVSTISYDGQKLSDDATAANEHMKISVNGMPVKIKKVTQGRGNGHSDYYFWFDLDLKKDDIKEVTVDFK